MDVNKVPQVDYAIIGGSSTFSINFPEDLKRDDVQIITTGLTINTPYGMSPPFKLFMLKKKKIITLKMHGWRGSILRADASRQVFWVLREAGVKKIVSEGGVGSINRLLRPRDVIVPTDYLDFSMRKDVGLGGSYLLTMRKCVCPDIRKELVRIAECEAVGRVFDRGVYAVTDGRHFESPAEIEMLYRLGADVVGQSMCPEVYLAREIGACYGRLDMVVNYAEGVIKEWDYEEMAGIFYNEPLRIGNILLHTLDRIDPGQSCGCPQYRKPTLLKD
ncbi:MAG: S-methyl-5'-thioinosine phosphorylase [Pelotomaculum sp. PtaB.Bin013]|uniref:MTAP family purine nucleoside phosphorylase n=1 Tax=Pelotomaculum isophthalicicum JI TaxID=947010 RepID=A0A9X4JVW2_9FIRM|nr:MTAP family purine nucleoside phosphorylase [Pelotomaculum isophthalicicum]MDF9408068.1 MTAP family purine nucleoside phosphorylase [Pelotomaculum isophthalicicum JI]OPX88949.1 MAG: S-methyl-5'-thioinosine phosphorylase [Pelotomaculum sp. PtaB.Bin013]